MLGPEDLSAPHQGSWPAARSDSAKRRIESPNATSCTLDRLPGLREGHHSLEQLLLAAMGRIQPSVHVRMERLVTWIGVAGTGPELRIPMPRKE
jgi:hypothetical protein